MPQPVAIFCCAASRDTALLDEWETHLLPLQQAGRITFWSECHLAPGVNRQEHIHNHLEKAEIIVLLLSADFFASPACMDLMTRALQRFHSGQAHLIPLLLRAVAWGDTAFRELSCLPRNAHPITQWSNRDEAFQDCLEDLKRLLTTPVSYQDQSAQSEQRSPSSSATYHSCFLSYAHQDEPLAQRLYTDLQAQGVQCWSAAHNMKIGAKIRPTIDEAIQRQEKILILLSQHSINSAWVEDEVETAFEYEQREQREMLFPVRLDESIMYTSQAWAAKLRRTRNIGDFTNWTEPGAYQRAFEQVLRDLENTES